MITLLDMMRVVVTLGLALTGFSMLSKYNIVLALLAALLGGYIGLCLGRLPLRYQIRRERKKLAALSVDDLKAELQNIHAPPPGWKLRFTPNYLLMELKARGQDVDCYIGYVLDLLESEGGLSRAFGVGALLSAFPHLARHLQGYSPYRQPDDCRQRVAKLRQLLAE